MIGWLSFAIQVVAIGMSSLATQIITVIVICFSTMLAVFRQGCEEFMIGKALKADLRSQLPGSGSHSCKDAYIALQLDAHQLEALKAWNLVPLRNGIAFAEAWRDDYERRTTMRD
jgi:hypothetical protein